MFSSKFRSISVAIAAKLGFLDTSQAKQADEAVAQDKGEHPTLGFLVDQGYLDEIQAQNVRVARQKEAPLEELNENIKKAVCAVRNAR